MTENLSSPPSESTAAPTETSNAPVNTSSTPEFSIPQEYQDKGWSEKIKSTDDLFKAYDNAQSLIGKRPAGIPSQDASDDEWSQFYKAMGRPDEANYEYGEVEGLPEGFDASNFQQQASELFHKAGLTPKQANELYQGYLQLELGAMAGQKEQAAELDKQYETLTKEHFGDEAEKYENLFMEDFSKHVPQSLKETMGKVADMPDVLAAMMAYTKGKQSEIDRIKKEYAGEGSITTGNQASGQSIDDVRRELATLRTSKEAKDFTHPNHKETQARIANLQESVQRYYKN